MSSADCVIWVHADCLHPSSPAYLAYPHAPSLFVWDEEALAAERPSLKRILFQYECLLELPVVIRRGLVAEEVIAFARQHGARRVITTDSPSPQFAAIRAQIEQALPVEVLCPPAFVYDPGPPDYRRFSRYWKRVEKRVMHPTDALD